MKVFFQFIITKLQIILNLKPVYKLPKNVSLNEGNIFDLDLNKGIKLNDVAYSILSLVDGKNSIDDIVNILLNKYKVDKSILERDVKALLEDLNGKNLVEYNIEGNKLVRSLFDLFIGQYMYKKRYKIPDSNILTFLFLLYLIAKKLFIIILFAIATSIYYVKGFSIQNNLIVYYFTFIASIIFGFVLHEWIHIVTTRLKKQKLNGYILLKRFTISIVKDTSDSSLISILFGPLIPSVIGILLLLISFSNNNRILLLVGLAFLTNIINLLPFTADGRGILEKILIKKMMKGK